ncbi:HAD family hydrolase [Bacillus cereus]|uniref:HAD family hydrolase n=2 Tax=Bacillus cereus group TaxID=86661 RepID=A0AAW9JFY0_BACTU|nr:MULTISPECIES: HAD family hydrolase [Bacillus cereus group]MBT2626916.1 HAD family phosphatase [Bacillus sp. ISL-32]MDN4873001.1 HAD family hydrolase [Bacillus cereus]MDZ5475622.1 HAD family hydrolase [Bacillus thuringiensis]MRB33264.1 HAD-IIB family hydrolase [Bacillus thuringiensis]WHT91513.1 HAD family hydrolase [Bacillus cereus]
MYKGLVLDIDNTIVRERKNKITDEDLSSIKYLNEIGVPIILATGRTHTNAQIIAEKIGLNNPIISSYGAMIRSSTSKNDLIYKKYNMEPEDVLTLMDIINSTPFVCGYIVTTNGTLFVSNCASNVKDIFRPFINYNTFLRNNLLYSVLQITIYNLDKNLKYHDRIYNLIQGSVKAKVTKKTRVIVLHSHKTNKGIALDELCTLRNWNIKEFIAIGDNEFDIPMFEKAAISIGFEKVYPYVDKKIKKENKRAIAECIEKYFIAK